MYRLAGQILQTFVYEYGLVIIAVWGSSILNGYQNACARAVFAAKNI